MSAVTLALLFFLSVGLKEVQACSCSPGHPQELFCTSEIASGQLAVIRAGFLNPGPPDPLSCRDYSQTGLNTPTLCGRDCITNGRLEVMRAKVTGEKIIHNNENLPGMGKIVYEIEVIEVFKGFDKINEIQRVYTNEMSSICGVRLAFGEYLLSGSILPEGFFISMCDYIEPWDKLSLMQKENLKYRYLKGCTCTIFTCIEKPCQPSTKNLCILTDWTSLWPYEEGISVNQSACIRHSNGSCGWYEETGKPSENDTIDMSED